MSIEIKEVYYDAWGNCLRLSNDIIETIVSIDYGPRIVSFRLAEGGNVLFEDRARTYTVSGSQMDEHYGTGAVFCRRGGHLASVAPIRMPESFFPDNSAVLYTTRPDGVSLISPREKSDGLKLSTDIHIGDGASDIMVVHSLKTPPTSGKSSPCGLRPPCAPAAWKSCRRASATAARLSRTAALPSGPER